MKLPVYQKVASAMDISPDLSKGACLLEVTGQNSVRVENYRRIMEYTDERLLLLGKTCRIEICGAGLKIETYTQEELLVTGRIEMIRYF